MDSSTSTSERDPLERLAAEFLDRRRRGEDPSPAEYARLHPEWAEPILEFFPALEVMEGLRPGSADRTASLDGRLAPAPPTNLERPGEYRIVREIGKGGMGVVHEAIQESLGRRVALKILPLHDETRGGNPPHSEPSDAGRSSVLARPSESGYDRAAARLGVQVAEAMAHAHGQGVLHRDIKPSNLLLDSTGHVWVADFGLAKVEGSDGPTQTGDIVGTLRYMAPERFDGWSDRRSDIYGLGMTLYEMLTLRPAYEAATRARLIQQVIHDPPPLPHKYDPRIPRDLETIVMKAIAKELHPKPIRSLDAKRPDPDTRSDPGGVLLLLPGAALPRRIQDPGHPVREVGGWVRKGAIWRDCRDPGRSDRECRGGRLGDTVRRASD